MGCGENLFFVFPVEFILSRQRWHNKQLLDLNVNIHRGQLCRQKKVPVEFKPTTFYSYVPQVMYLSNVCSFVITGWFLRSQLTGKYLVASLWVNYSKIRDGVYNCSCEFFAPLRSPSSATAIKDFQTTLFNNYYNYNNFLIGCSKK